MARRQQLRQRRVTTETTQTVTSCGRAACCRGRRGADPRCRQTDRQTDREALLPGGTSAGEALTAAYPQPPQVCSRIPLYGADCGLSSVVWERCNNVNKEGYLMPTPRTHSAYRHTLAPPMYRSKLAFFARRFVNIYICVGDVLGEHTEGHHLPTRTHGLNCCRVTEPSAAHPSSWPYRLGSSRPTFPPHTPKIGIALPS